MRRLATGFTVWAILLIAATVVESGSDSTRVLLEHLGRGNLVEAEAGAVRLLEETLPRDRADSLIVLDATRVLIETRLRLFRHDDSSMIGLVDSYLSMCGLLLEPDAIEKAHAHQYAGFLARWYEDRAAEAEHFRKSLEIIESHDPPIYSEQAIALSNLATTHFRSGDYEESLELLEQALRIQEEHLSPEHPAVAATLVNLNEARIALFDTSGVTSDYDRAVRILEQGRGTDEPQLADILHRQGTWGLRRGELLGARQSLDRAIGILNSRIPGSERLAASLLARAQVDLAGSDGDSALTRVPRALEIYESLYGKGSLEVASCLVTLGDAYRQAFRHDEATDVYLHALAILERPPERDSIRLADCLRALASHSLELGRSADAVVYARRTLGTTSRAWGPQHRETANARLAYAAALRSAQQPDSALAQCKQALADLNAVVDRNDPVLAEPFLCIGAIARERGDLPEARASVEHALELIEGTEDPKRAECYHELAIVQRRTGDLSGARASLDRALQIAGGRSRERLPVAGILSSIATLERASGDTLQATRHFRESLEILDRVVGTDHPEYALVLRNLASLENASGRFAEAENRYRSALGILQRSLEQNHPNIAATHLGLGNALKQLGKMEEAREHYMRAIEIHLEALGAQAPALALDYHNLAALLLESGELETAMEKAGEAERLSQQHFRLIAEGVSEREALHYSAQRVSGADIVLTAAARSESAANWERAWNLVIRSRAVVLDVIADRRQFLASKRDPVVTEPADRLAAASNELAHLAVRGRGSESVEQYKTRLAEARLEKEAAERRLAEKSKIFASRKAEQRIGLQEILDALPTRSALIAWVQFDRLERRTGVEIPSRWSGGEPSYAAFVVDGVDRKVRFVPLGGAEKIDAQVSEWHRQAGTGTQLLGRPGAENAYREAGEKLRRAVWDPVAAGLEDLDRIFLVPDGALALVNFDALPHDSAGFLLEHAPLLHLLSSERELARENPDPTDSEGLLTVAAPDYEQLPGTQTGGGDGSRSVPRGLPCGQFKSLWFVPLPGTAVEKGEVVQLWKEFGASLGAGSRPGRGKIYGLEGPAATERDFKRLAIGRQVIHIATHGFFLGAECAGSRAKSGSAPRDELTVSGLVAESPLLLSGLAFAGANQREEAPDSDDDGVLTAEEITALNLEGVDWVVLSACETGLGKIEAGEGVFGLRRAFQIAGARNLVMTMWSVDDDATAAWMKALFESSLRDQLTVAKAVRAASLEILRRRRSEGATTHPFYWGAFVATGDWN